MKQLTILISMITLLFCSCNNNKEPDLEINLPINSEFIPASIEINRAEMNEQEREEIKNLVNNRHIVNDISELPDDPIGQNEAFHKINFQENTLLIMYVYHRWSIDTYANRFYRNTGDNSYNWIVKLGVTTDEDNETEVVQLTRFAILVRKLPADADIEIWRSLTEF
ncbi:MAG: hypothetical protein J1F07_06435 [Muribaculaceae bacterium]|nr:hypothetical protein [Muribaculaceae bacterium]